VAVFFLNTVYNALVSQHTVKQLLVNDSVKT